MDGPNAVPLGRLVYRGAKFIWEDFWNPCLIDENGTQIPLHVEAFVPVLGELSDMETSFAEFAMEFQDFMECVEGEVMFDEDFFECFDEEDMDWHELLCAVATSW